MFLPGTPGGLAETAGREPRDGGQFPSIAGPVLAHWGPTSGLIDCSTGRFPSTHYPFLSQAALDHA